MYEELFMKDLQEIFVVQQHLHFLLRVVVRELQYSNSIEEEPGMKKSTKIQVSSKRKERPCQRHAVIRASFVKKIKIDV